MYQCINVSGNTNKSYNDGRITTTRNYRIMRNFVESPFVIRPVIGSCREGLFGRLHLVLQNQGKGVRMTIKGLTKNKMVEKDWHCNVIWMDPNLLELLQSAYRNRLYFAFRGELLLLKPYNQFLGEVYDHCRVKRKFIGLKHGENGGMKGRTNK
eukprot:53522_1